MGVTSVAGFVGRRESLSGSLFKLFPIGTIWI